MLSNVDKNVFLNSDEVLLLPSVSAEWNQNLFNSPYLTVAGNGIKETVNPSSFYTVVTGDYAHPNFNTYSFLISSSEATSVSYTCSTATSQSAYKIITYVKTDNYIPVMINAYASGTSTQYGSKQVEVNNYGWTKVEVFMGGSSEADYISDITFNIVCNTFTDSPISGNVYFTKPEIYENEYFNYQYNSIFSTDSVCNVFRPGESYIGTGNSNINFPSNFRKVTTSDLVGGISGDIYAPVSSIIQNPQYLFITQYIPFMKNFLPTDIAPYKYFVSDSPITLPNNTVVNPSITAIYPSNISTNKIVLKFNTLITVPTISLYLNGSGTATYSGAVPSNGVLVLYYTGSSWSTSKWSNAPTFDSSGNLTNYTSINKITVVQTSISPNTYFPARSSSSYNQDLQRMHLIEMSPRLEIDLSNYVEDVAVTKQLDSKSTVVPLSTINTDDVVVTLSALPVYTLNGPVPLFSNQSNASSTILANMLRKNIKLYINWNLKSYSSGSTYANTYIPTGVFYVDSWDESDIETVKIQGYDSIRRLQTLPAPDYVVNYKSVFDIVTGLLDRAGFTDYDIDSLYTVTNDKSLPMDMSYFYANSQDTTVADTLTQIFLAYQIGAYMDEYNVMRFLSLANILNSSSQTSSVTLQDKDIYQGGYATTNTSKVGKISLRYQEPKIKQSLSIQNADPTHRNDPSFIYTTSNEHVWSSSSIDSIGFNYLGSNMLATDNVITLNKNDLLDTFHTFNLNNNGYVVIENEIVSFAYKEYTISTTDNSATPKTVSVKNDIELAAEIDKYVRNNSSVQLTLSDGTTYSGQYSSNVQVTPTGKITNVQRGLFGTVPATHNVISSLSDKSLSQALVSGSSVSVGGTGAQVYKYQPINAQEFSLQSVGITPSAGNKVLLYPTSQEDIGYHTYSTKFNISYDNLFSGGIFFNMSNSMNTTEGAYFVEFIKSFTSTTTVYVPDPTSQTDGTISVPTNNYNYYMVIYQISGGSPNIISWSDITNVVTNLLNNMEKVFVQQTSGNVQYKLSKDEAFHLKVVHFQSDGSDGEEVGEIVQVFLNNAQIIGWQVADTSGNELSNGWKQTNINTVTGVRQFPSLGTAGNYAGTQFGAYISTSPVPISTLTYNAGNSVTMSVFAGGIREIYATQAILKDRSNNYWWQTTQFLSSLVQNQNIFNSKQSYCMQTSPSAIGINVYDVQYQTPAATNVDILPVQYYQVYFPGGAPTDNAYKQSLTVDEYGLAYSTPINTGFRGKFAIANNSPYMVWIHKTPDQLNQTSIMLVLWTHEIVAQSDPAIIEKVINPNNLTEVAQIDTTWIQSQYAANKMVSVIAQAIDGFSKDTVIKVFGNPLIQLGDIVTVNYSLLGLNNRTFVVQGIKHTFKEGLETDLTLNAVGPGWNTTFN